MMLTFVDMDNNFSCSNVSHQSNEVNRKHSGSRYDIKYIKKLRPKNGIEEIHFSIPSRIIICLNRYHSGNEGSKGAYFWRFY